VGAACWTFFPEKYRLQANVGYKARHGQGEARVRAGESVPSPKLRVKQAYDTYLDSLYDIECYKRVYNDTEKYGRHFEFVIALSGALSGGSGLGILASSWMAIPCSILTAIALILSVAKQTYAWPKRASFAVDMIERNGRIAGKLKDLVQDIQAFQNWNAEFQKRFDAVRSEINTLPAYIGPELNVQIRSSIQDEIINSERPEMWWKPEVEHREEIVDAATTSASRSVRPR
jgi:hypothetical protein